MIHQKSAICNEFTQGKGTGRGLLFKGFGAMALLRQSMNLAHAGPARGQSAP